MDPVPGSTSVPQNEHVYFLTIHFPILVTVKAFLSFEPRVLFHGVKGYLLL